MFKELSRGFTTEVVPSLTRGVDGRSNEHRLLTQFLEGIILF